MTQAKKPLDMTTDEAVAFLFPKKAIEELKNVAHSADKKPPEKPVNTDLECDDEPAYEQDSK